MNPTIEEIGNWGWYTGNLKWLKSRTIFLTKHGSQAYGTSTPQSDLDIKGIAIAPKEYYLGYLNSFEQAEVREPLDAVIYDVRKFFKLASDCNPNIIEVLFTDIGDWILATEAWTDIHAHRYEFLSKKALHTFSGYAVAQVKRIQSHRHWLLNQPKKQPERSDFGLKNGESTIGKEQLGVINARISKLSDNLAGKGLTKPEVEAPEVEDNLVRTVVALNDLSKELIPIIIAERKYASACRNWSSFQKWKTERNEDRAKLEAQFGYDTKHGAHVVRLLRMLTEILRDGEVVVRRPDAEELLEVRRGAWSYDKLMEFATDVEKSLPDILAKSPLPYEPDRKALDEVLVNVIIKFEGIGLIPSAI